MFHNVLAINWSVCVSHVVQAKSHIAQPQSPEPRGGVAIA
jgi:hypothetical protein